MSEYERGSRKDALTNLLDRDGFDRELKHAVLHTPGEFALAIIDVNSFKSINTEYGHPEGNKFLRNLADVLKLILREDDCILFRIGGDEFSILLRGAASEESVHAVVSRINSELGGLGIDVSIDAQIHNLGESAEDLEIRVDDLTTQVQRKGKRNKYPPKRYGKAVREIGRIAAEYDMDHRDLEVLLDMDAKGEYVQDSEEA